MALSWIGAVKAVPWGDVIAAAPSVVQGANALWDRVAKKRRKDETSPVVPPGASDDERIAALEQSVAELHREAQAATQLIRSLAEQNAQLVREVGALRLRLRMLTVAGLGALVLLVALVVLLPK